jgi:hypothetical protein
LISLAHAQHVEFQFHFTTSGNYSRTASGNEHDLGSTRRGEKMTVGFVIMTRMVHHQRDQSGRVYPAPQIADRSAEFLFKASTVWKSKSGFGAT